MTRTPRLWRCTGGTTPVWPGWVGVGGWVPALHAPTCASWPPGAGHHARARPLAPDDLALICAPIPMPRALTLRELNVSWRRQSLQRTEQGRNRGAPSSNLASLTSQYLLFRLLPFDGAMLSLHVAAPGAPLRLRLFGRLTLLRGLVVTVSYVRGLDQPRIPSGAGTLIKFRLLIMLRPSS